MFRILSARSSLLVVGIPRIPSQSFQIRTMGSISAFDSIIFRNLFGTDEIRSIFSDQAYVKRCVDVETGLARAQAHCNVIPAEAAKEITALSNTGGLDFDRLRNETDIVGYPILPLDIMDTASVLQIKDGLAVVEGKLDSVISALERLSLAHRDTPMAGRTHLQHALPVTFGYKCAVWLSGLQRHKERLRQLVPRALVVQYGGAAGTLASLGPGEDGLNVRRQLAKEMGLADPPITWHVARDGIAEVTNLLALIGGTLGKVALDLIFMSSNELERLPSPSSPTVVPLQPCHKREIPSRVSMVADFERASGPWHLEWVAIPESFVMAVGALHQAEFVLAGLEVSKTQMAANLALSKGLIVGEAVMMSLANHMGRQNAHDVVYKACKETIELGGDVTLLQTLKKDQRVLDTVSTEELESLCDPMNYMGSSQRMVDSILSLQNE
uniref:Adenylosuccinate lyase C-terminal domain-containing protein n=1 Tax=Bionectria ochroleuca TaxID=29856 RepID=A0A8H7MZN0_BIOOC